MKRGYLDLQERIDILQTSESRLVFWMLYLFDDDWIPQNVDSVYQQELADIPLLEYNEADTSEDDEDAFQDELTHESLGELRHEVVSSSDKKSTHQSTHESENGLEDELENESNDRFQSDDPFGSGLIDPQIFTHKSGCIKYVAFSDITKMYCTLSHPRQPFPSSVAVEVR